MSNVAHPGLTVTNLQGSGPNLGRDSRSAMSRTFPWLGRHFPSVVQQVDPALMNDHLTGYLLAIGVVAALAERERTAVSGVSPRR